METFFGANHNLKKLIETHLFVICPNKSGSTFLKEALATSKRTWNLAREGQHTFGFAGPSSMGLRSYNRWASNPEWVDVLSDPDRFDWATIRRAWYFQAHSQTPTAPIFIEKSPPFLLIVDNLVRVFPDARFLFMVRNPYAVVEGIRRKSPQNWLQLMPASESIQVLADHVITCLDYQRRNVRKWRERGAFFTYEQMCDESEMVQNLIASLVPEIDDLVLSQRIPVKQYNEELRNMNDQQIERLNARDIEEINKVFSKYPDVMEFFNYSFL